VFLTYKAEVENQLKKKIKRIRSDRGGEYCDYCEVLYSTTTIITPLHLYFTL